MEKKEILESLNEIVYRGTKISKIEKEVGLPQNSLSSVLTGKKQMPNKWVTKLEAFVQSPAIIGHQKPPLPDLWPADLMEKINTDKAQRDWLTKDALKIYEWCEKKGFSPSELIGKYEDLEAKLAQPLIERNREQWGKYLTESQNKPFTDLGVEKRTLDTPEWGKGQEKAKNGSKSDFEKAIEANLPEIPPMPVRMEGENSVDFGARKSDWKRKYGQ